MNKIFVFFLYWVLRIFFALRYRLKVKGLENLNPETLNKKGGVLFLPNHPAVLVDPVLIALAVWKKYPIRPMVVEYMYYTPIVGWVLRKVNAIPVPDFTASNSLKRKKSEQVLQNVVDGLNEKENFLIYPAGKTKSTGLESVGGASGVNKIIHDAPDTNIVLVRIKGLWGSSFSRAFLGKAPPIFPTTRAGIKYLLKNLIFFTPRREVIVEFTPAPADFPYKASRLDMNRWLETWYNKPDGLTPQKGDQPGDSFVLVSYSMWGDVFSELPKKQELDRTIDLKSIPDATKEKIINKIGELADFDKKRITPEMDIAIDIGMDSLDTAELVGFLQDQFDIDSVPVSEMTTVAHVMGIASKQIVTHEKVDESHVNLKKWHQQFPHNRASVPPGVTIPEVFLNQCSLSGGSKPACGDDRMGMVTYSQMKVRMILLAEYIHTLPGQYVGILLPASVMANTLILATQLAGKTPLMVNWTVGPRHLESVIKLSNVQVVLTSWAFLDKVENLELNGMEDRLVMLEDIKHRFTLGKKLKALFRSKFGTKSVLKLFGADKKTKDDIAVLLFTSGTEGMPKGVPLSHENILSNHKSIVAVIQLFSDDVIQGILPPFHSFGFTVSGLLGLMIGTRIAFYPNPTEGKNLAKNIEKWGVTIGCGAPTFIRGILRNAKPEQVASMRLCATGAEKCPQDLFKMMADLGKPGILCEGYGITECSPVLTFNKPYTPQVGVGKAAPSVDIMIVDPETNVPLKQGERGMIIAHGPNIFSGYINPGLSSPFAYVDDRKWFKTGDLGFMDEEGNITISGRQKRFVKVGPEMISLASIEEALLEDAVRKKLSTSPEGPSLAVCSKEQEGEKPRFYVFSVFPLTVEEANTALKDAGFTNLVKITGVNQLPELPLLGTGKINYRVLESEYSKPAVAK